MAGSVETINISKASTTTNLFYLFFHGGKAAIIPFLTLFLRLVGLNAQEVGAIIAVKTVTSLIWAPLWARCATAYSRHRCVLVFSLFMMMVMYLSFPALYMQLSRPEHCSAISGSNNSVDLPHYPSEHILSTAPADKPSFSNPYSTTLKPTSAVSTKLSTPSTGKDELIKGTLTTAQSTTKEISTEQSAVTQLISASSKTSQTEPSTESSIKGIRPELLETFRAMLKELSQTKKEFINSNLTVDEFRELLNIVNPDLKATQREVSRLDRLLKSEASEDFENKVS